MNFISIAFRGALRVPGYESVRPIKKRVVAVDSLLPSWEKVARRVGRGGVSGSRVTLTHPLSPTPLPRGERGYRATRGGRREEHLTGVATATKTAQWRNDD